MIDIHAHFANGNVILEHSLDLGFPAVRNVRDVLERVGAAVREADLGEWIEGHGWDEGKLKERRQLLAADLDPVSEDHSVFLRHTTGHYAVANTEALRRAGITRDTPDPPGGTIDRDRGGNPTGVLTESAQTLVRQHVPPPDVARTERAVRRMSRELNRECKIGLKGPGLDQRVWDAYQAVLATDDRTVRVLALWRVDGTLPAARNLLDRLQALSAGCGAEASLRASHRVA